MAPWLIFFASVGWALDGSLRNYLGLGWSAQQLVFLEHAIALPVILPLLWFYRRSLLSITRTEWACVIFIGVGGSALATMALTQSFKHVNPFVALLLLKLQPLVSISLGRLILQERMGRWFWLWACVAISCAALLVLPELLSWKSQGSPFNAPLLGAMFALSAALLWGSCTVFGKYLLYRHSFSLVTSLRFAIGFVFLALLSLTGGSTILPVFHAHSRQLLALLVMMFTSGVGNLFVYYRGLTKTSASVAAIAELGYPLTAVLIASFHTQVGRFSVLQVVAALGLTAAIFMLNAQVDKTGDSR